MQQSRPPTPTATRPRSPSDAIETWGAFCLANDGVFDWAVGLFESFRTMAPELRLLVIPYDDRQERLQRLVEHYQFDYYSPSVLARFDALGQRFYPGQDFPARGFRKLACFSGPFTHFFFCDTDVVLLTQLTALRAAAVHSKADIVHFDTDLDQVYQPGPYRERLLAENDARGFNCGLFMGRRDALDAERLEAVLDDLDSRWQQLLVPNAEQPFLNLYADRVRLEKRAAHELVPDYCSTCWPAVGTIQLEDGEYRLRQAARWDEGRRLFFAHWAGYSLEQAIPNRHLYLHYRNLAEAQAGLLDIR